jgi:hypothetical protein
VNDRPGSSLLEPWTLRLHDLMPFRVREILVLSSPYDAFALEEDGRLTERIFTEYSELNLSSAPRVTHVSTAAKAMELLAERRFDLIVTMVRIADTDVSDFGRRVKERFPGIPVVLLVLTEGDLRDFPGGVDPAAVDHVFWWTGDARILVAIVKLVEDAKNAPHDTRVGGVRVIVVVEDSVRRYSSFLSLLYAELMVQSGSLVAEGVNDLHRMQRMRARPKVVLATTYEEAMALFDRYREFVVALISDVRFPRGAEEDPTAGFDLVEAVRGQLSDLPVLLQSAEPANAARAVWLGVAYADKGSSSLLGQLRQFVTVNLGFGDFVFRLPDGQEVGRARDMYELQQTIRWIPAESLAYHASHNHFSIWLMARCMFGLAAQLRPRRVEEWGDTEGLRQFLLGVLDQARLDQQEGVVTDFSARQTGPRTRFVRLGKGSLGGKARGVAFISSLLARHGLENRFPEMSIRIPRSLVVPTEEFDRFLESNRILDGGLDRLGEQQILDRCLAGRLSDDTMRDIEAATHDMLGPLAVRSSSLLEDSQHQAFAGIYATYMLPNNHLDREERLEQIFRAVRAVYASTYSNDARAYIGRTAYSIEEEKMAVLIQEIVGRAHGDASESPKGGKRLYPNVGGVAVSYNYYPVGQQKAEEGLAMVALGLGHTVVQGGAALQFSPATPAILPQFGSALDYLRYGQSRFWAVDLDSTEPNYGHAGIRTLRQYDLSDAEADGTLQLVGSTYSPDDDSIRDNLAMPGPRIVTFNNLLRWNALPLAPALVELLPLLQEGLSCPVEVEFALDAGGASGPACLYLLQVRPQATFRLETVVAIEDYATERVLCRTDRALGNGVIEGIRDVVLVKRDDLDARETPAVAEQVSRLNARLAEAKTPYILIGPGRWGSSDPRLGIPVRWSHIAGARVIVETSFRDREVEPSQGAHFFHNVTSFRIGYLTMPGALHPAPASACRLDLDWLAQQPVADETDEVRHVRLDAPLRVLIDGRRSVGVILKG